jgi:hypothetical protein
MPSPKPSGSARAEPVLRVAIFALGIALALASLSWYRALSERQEEAARWLEGLGIPREEPGAEAARTAAPRLDREPDPDRVGLRAARAALAAELDPSLAPARAPLPGGRAERASAARLAETARRAGAALAEKPASWDAAMILGAATYLSWSQARDPRLFTQYREWERPIQASLRLAPGKREPVRFLTAAYLEIWPALSPAKKREARRLLAETFRNPRDLEMLLEPWLEAAGSLQAASALIPEDPEAWRRVQEALAHRGDWQGWSFARAHWEAALLASLRRDLDQAGRRMRRGDLVGARALYLSAAGRSRPDGRYRQVLETALTLCPPGPVDRETGDRLLPHLHWAVDRCVFGECPLSQAALKRLAFFARDAEPPLRAMASLFAGDLPRAESFERQGAGFWNEGWAPYLVVKARSLVERGQVEEAREALALVHRSWHDRPIYWQARGDLARALGDDRAAAQAEARLEELARAGWPAFAWTWRRGVARLELIAERPGRLAVAIDEVQGNGGAVELRLDGTALGAFPVRTGAGPGGGALPLTPSVPVGRGLHLLEVETLMGGRVLPGDVSLR